MLQNTIGPLEVIEIIGGFIGIIAIIIVIWDHFKDDRKLTKQVQEFYENFENLLASFIQKKSTESSHTRENYAKYVTETTYYECEVIDKFPEYSKYLGLT
ncbi:MAG: hypothetical protein ACFE96_17755, partial [Candidatus Hermodarchaeota archaeon]